MHLSERSEWSVGCRVCGWRSEPGIYPHGCPSCLERGEVQAVLVNPPDPVPPAQHSGNGDGIWNRWGNWLPAVPAQHRRTLGEGGSPLLRIDWLSEVTGCSEVYLKMEATNPTGSHKDRYHAVTSAVAAALGVRGVVSSSTGNHGLSMTVYARLHGLEAVVLCNQRMPSLLQRAIHFSGGLPLMAPPELATDIVTDLVEREGFLPATTLWPMPIANPYGIEGYKTIAWEIDAAFESRPAWILVPTAGADLLTGIWLGFEDLERTFETGVRPRLCACQPEGAAPLVQALRSGSTTIPRLEDAHSIALSIADPITGQIALDAIAATNGDAIAVSDAEILAMGKLLASHGLLVEPSSAASVASLPHLAARHPEMRGQPVVCIVTSSALKWLDDYGASSAQAAIRVDSALEAQSALRAHG